MPRQFLVAIIALGAALLIATGVLAGIVIANNGGKGVSAGTTYLGVQVRAERGGLYVTEVQSSSPAAAAGIQAGDLIRSIDGKVVRTPEQLRSTVEEYDGGDRVSITFERGDREVQASARLSTRPVSSGAADPTPQPTSTATSGAQGLPDLSALPPQVRERVRQLFEQGLITREQIEQLTRLRSNAAKSGVITEVSAGSLTIQTFDDETFSTAITPTTAIRKGSQVLTAADLQVGETVFIISMDGGATAFSINTFGVLPSLP